MADVKIDKEERCKISVIVPYCSFESDLIRGVVESLQICDEVIIVYLTHFFNGEEDREAESTINLLKDEFSNVIPIRIKWKPANVPQAYWVCEMRMHGFAKSTKDWILCLDSDEMIRNPTRFKEWFHLIEDKEVKSYKLANYWYFMSKQRRSKVIEDSITLTHRSVICMSMFRDFNLERSALLLPGSPRKTLDLHGDVMFDHFSWVRTPKNLLRKVKSWGHRKDRDWVPLVEKALREDPLTTEDFVHGYDYIILEPSPSLEL